MTYKMDNINDALEMFTYIKKLMCLLKELQLSEELYNQRINHCINTSMCNIALSREGSLYNPISMEDFIDNKNRFDMIGIEKGII